MDIVSLDQVNQFVLRKQYLINKADNVSIVQVVHSISGLHATSATTPYLSLFSRMRNFKKEALDEELYQKKNLGKIRCIRKTIFVLSKDVIPIAFAATNKMVEPVSEKYSKYLGVSKQEYEETSKEIVSLLQERGMTALEIRKTLGRKRSVSPIVNLMCDQGFLIRGPPRKGWKSSTHTYFLFNEYFPDIDLSSIEEADARALIIKQYIASFGPVTEEDITWWTGFPKIQIRQILQKIQDLVFQLKIKGCNRKYLILTSEEESLMNETSLSDPLINLLPRLDSYIMGYRDRERYLEPERYNYIFDRSGNSASTILLNGRVIGIWDFEDRLIKVFLFDNVHNTIFEEIYRKATELGNFVSGKGIQLRECNSMIPLPQRRAGGFMTPLKNC